MSAISDLQPKVRTIPITILDLLGVFIPGFVWLLLITTAIDVVRRRQPVTPVETIRDAIGGIASSGGWLPTTVILIAVLVIGSIVKPWSMAGAELVCQRLGLYRSGGLPLGRFPFIKEFEQESKVLYNRVCTIVHEVTGLSAEEVQVRRLFNVAKRCLRLLAPTLWEESERREAEVRLYAGLLLPMLFSTVIAIVALGFGLMRHPGMLDATLWLFLSLIGTALLASGLGELRTREVLYTYMSLVIAYGLAARQTSISGEVLKL